MTKYGYIIYPLEVKPSGTTDNMLSEVRRSQVGLVLSIYKRDGREKIKRVGTKAETILDLLLAGF